MYRLQFLKNVTVFLFAFSMLFFVEGFAQRTPKYTPKSFVTVFDSTKLKSPVRPENGFFRTYLPVETQIFDLDDNNSTYIAISAKVLLCFEGESRNNKREGVFNVYLIDSLDYDKRYKIWEQTFVNDKLTGLWNVYTLKGTLTSFQTYRNDSLNGIARNLWIDGKTIMDETEYFNGSANFTIRNFHKNGKIQAEIPHLNNKITGLGKKFYENGTLQESAHFENGAFNGTRKYYYPNGQLWIEQVYKQGKSWTVVANYTEDGKKRNAGTLKNGNGTIIFYNEDGSIRETISYINGEEKH